MYLSVQIYVALSVSFCRTTETDKDNAAIAGRKYNFLYKYLKNNNDDMKNDKKSGKLKVLIA